MMFLSILKKDLGAGFEGLVKSVAVILITVIMTAAVVYHV